MSSIDEQRGVAEVNGTGLYYESAGSGHPLVLIHGFGLDTRMCDDQFEVFARRYRVVRYDMRGYGDSAPPPDESYSHTADLKALLEHLSIDRAHVLGQSRGGAVAIDFALAHPGATSALVLVDPVLGGHSWAQEAARTDGAVWETAAQSGAEAGKARWLAHPLFAPAHEKPEVAARLRRIISDYSGWHLINTDPVRYPDPPAAQRIQEISAPTLIVVGERDLPDFHVIADTLQQIPDARKVVLPGVGHMCNMEAPAGSRRSSWNFSPTFETVRGSLTAFLKTLNADFVTTMSRPSRCILTASELERSIEARASGPFCRGCVKTWSSR